MVEDDASAACAAAAAIATIAVGRAGGAVAAAAALTATAAAAPVATKATDDRCSSPDHQIEPAARVQSGTAIAGIAAATGGAAISATHGQRMTMAGTGRRRRLAEASLDPLGTGAAIAAGAAIATTATGDLAGRSDRQEAAIAAIDVQPDAAATAAAATTTGTAMAFGDIDDIVRRVAVARGAGIAAGPAAATRNVLPGRHDGP